MLSHDPKKTRLVFNKKDDVVRRKLLADILAQREYTCILSYMNEEGRMVAKNMTPLQIQQSAIVCHQLDKWRAKLMSVLWLGYLDEVKKEMSKCGFFVD